MSEASASNKEVSALDVYGENYYACHCGNIPYDRSQPHWGEFFGKIADELVRTFRPRRAFDAGCALGFLVEALWDRGVRAYGRDISEYAISNTRSDIRQFCSVGSLSEPIEGPFDLVTCIEVLEHMTEEEGMTAIANMTAAADRIVFSSSPTDLTEPTHINVKPPIYWIEAFAAHDFAPLIETTLFSITPYALAFERGKVKPSDDYLHACAEIVRNRMKRADDARVIHELSVTINARDRALAEKTAEFDGTIASFRERFDTEKNQTIASLVADRDRLDTEKSQTIASLVADRDRLDTEKDQTIASLVADRDRLDTEKNQTIASLVADRDRLETEKDRALDLSAVLRTSLHEVMDAYTNLQGLVDQFSRSRSWRVVRELERIMRRLRPLRGPARRAADLLAEAKASSPVGFDRDFYVSKYPDIAQAGIDPLQHYLHHGRAEGRHANALAAAGGGGRPNAPIAQAGIDPPQNYFHHGQAEGRHANALAAAGGALRPNAPFAPDFASISLTDLCSPDSAEPGAKMADSLFCVSVLTPVYNTSPRHLRELYQTLANQIYANWEWVIVDDGSTTTATITALKTLAEADPRIRVLFNLTNQGIAGASNRALEAARGTHAALVDHDDLVSRDAFLAIFEAWQKEPSTQLFFTDECKLLPDGTLGQFWPKPDWSPTYLENTMCLGHLSVYELNFLRKLGGFRSEYDGTQDYDLALRAALAQPKVVHLPIFAYLWRIIEGSAALDLSEKSYAVQRQGKAVLDYARYKHSEAEVIPGWGAGYWRIIYPVPSPPPLLSYIIPAGGGSRTIGGERIDLVVNCVRSFEASAFYPNREYIVVHNGGLPAAQTQALSTISNVRFVVHADPTFNFSRTVNAGVAAARGEYICLLNDDVEAITVRGGEELVSYLAVNPRVGAIGPMCLREDKRIQQNGVVLLANGPAHAGDGQPQDFGGHQSMLRCRREAFCIGGAILLTNKELYELVGGFDENLPLNYNDVDFCLRLRERGYSCVIDPGIEVYHYESATKINTSTVEQERLFLKHPGVTDPYFNRWFDQGSPLYRLRLRREETGRGFGQWLDRLIARRAPQFVPEGGPKLSVCVSVYNQPMRFLEEMYKSVLMQTYANRELLILDNGSSNPETIEWLRRVQKERDVTYIRSDKYLGIGEANLKLLESVSVSGEFFIPMNADDFLSVDALQIVAYEIQRNPTGKIFYTDEYKSDANSTRFEPFFKPDFDPILAMNCCYPGRLMAIEVEFLRRIGSSSDDWATWRNDYDLLTRALSLGEAPIHISELVYARRIHSSSTALAETLGQRETVGLERLALLRLLKARGLDGVLSIEPNKIEPSIDMWRLKTKEPVTNVKILDAREVWGAKGLGVSGLVSAASERDTEWIAILVAPDDAGAVLELSAIALFEPRINAVSGVLVDDEGIVNWSGGLFLPRGRVFDPYGGQPFSGGGYHGELWCQRCIDVAAPVNVLIRASAIRRVPSPAGVACADSLMVKLGLDAHERGDLIAVTPHLQASPALKSLVLSPLDRAGLLGGAAALERGSRWYDGRLEWERPYKMPEMA